ncbi:ER membrane protein complex subunit 4 [Monosporozyma servazzii]
MTEQLPQWVLNLTDSKTTNSLKEEPKSKLPAPFGYKPVVITGGKVKHKNSANGTPSSQNINQLQIQKAWQIAFGPAKSIPMNFVMSYMSGTSLQIIPIMTALMLLSGPIKALFTILTTFKPVLGNKEIEPQVRVAMFVFILGQGALMYIGIRKLNQMGVIPNTASDWLVWEKLIDYNRGIESYTF